MRARELMLATAALVLLALLATGSGLLGRSALRAEGWLDFDPLYRGAAGAVPPFDDFSPLILDLPRDLMVARHLHAGDLASWNPLSACGAPLWAEQGGPFFPLKLPLYLWPTPFGHDLWLVLRLLAAGVGAYVLARLRGSAPLPALVAGGTFQLSGALVELFAFASFSPVFVLPWVLAGAALLARRADRRSAAAAALALGVAASGAHPTLTLLVYAAFAAAVVGYLTAARHARAAAALLVWSGVAVLLGLALAAPTLLPLADLVAHAQSHKYAAVGAVSWRLALDVARHSAPLALFAPHLLAALQPTLAINHAAAAMVGTLPLVLAVTGVLRGGLDRGLLAVAVLGVALALAPPALGWVGQLPGLQYLLPVYAWALVALPLTQAAGAGAAALATPRGALAAVLALFLVAGASASLLLVADVAGMPDRPRFATLLHGALDAPGGWWRLAAVPALAAGGVLAAVAVARWRPAATGGVVVAAGVLAAGELVLLSRPWLVQPRAAAGLMNPSPAVRWLAAHLEDGGGRFLAAPGHVGFGLTPMLFGLADVRGTAGLPVARYQAYAAASTSGGSDGVHQTLALLSSPLRDRAAVRYVVVPLDGAPPQPLERLDPALSPAYVDAQVAVFENRGALPRARIARPVVPLADADAARARLVAMVAATRMGKAVAPDASVGLEPAAGGIAPPAVAAVAAADASAERVRLLAGDDPDRVTIEAELVSPGVVVLADTWFPGWTATVDGAPAPIHPADLLFRGVAVPAGRHRIEFHYAPRGLAAGAGIALLAAAACIVLAWPRADASTR